jgi:pimeloyl-ACP methyl ester carboxylesterase
MSQGLSLSFLEAGESTGGTPLLVLHGLFGSARNWQSIARRLGERRHVFALDLRNHGGAPWAATMTYPEMAADVLRFLDDRGYPRAAVLGHSMGGKVAMTLALDWPRRVERLMVADIAPVTYTHTHAPYVAAMLRANLSGVTRRGEVDEQLAAAVPEPALRSFLLQNLAMEHGQFRWRINLEAIGDAMASLIGFPDPGQRQYTGPALFIGGGASDYITPELAPVIARSFPAARIEMVPDAGHWVHAEKPDLFTDLVEGFL